jgi:hypothetical protein
MVDNKSQLDNFKKTAREIGADEDEKRWEERVKKVEKRNPQPKDERASVNSVWDEVEKADDRCQLAT